MGGAVPATGLRGIGAGLDFVGSIMAVKVERAMDLGER
jgi:hypothetical protein